MKRRRSSPVSHEMLAALLLLSLLAIMWKLWIFLEETTKS